MLIVMIVIAVLSLLAFIYIRDEGIEHQKRQAEQIRELLIVNGEYRKFIDFVLETLSEHPADPYLGTTIFKYLYESEIDISPKGGK